MNILLEALRMLKEDNETNNYPTKCKSYSYKVKVNDSRLLCGSFVLSRNFQYPELGFNITTPNARTEVDGRKALQFLTEQDVRAFCNKYGFTTYKTYLSRVYTTLIRIDNNTNIPTYMSNDGVNEFGLKKNRLTNTQLANYNSEIQSADNLVFDVIKQKNIAKENAYSSAVELGKVCDQLVNYVNNLPECDFKKTTPLGVISAKFELKATSSEILANPPPNPELYIVGKISTDFAVKGEYGIIPLMKEARVPSIYEKGDTLVQSLTKKYNGRFNMINSFDKTSSIFRLVTFEGKINYGIRDYIYYHSLQLDRVYKQPEDLEKAKQLLKNMIVKNNQSLAQDMDIGFEQLKDIEKFIADLDLDTKVELGYDDFK